MAVTVVILVAVLTLIGVAADLLERHGTRGQGSPEAFDQTRPEPRRAPGRVFVRVDRAFEIEEEPAAPRVSRRGGHQRSSLRDLGASAGEERGS
jgi:hypothetical protein